MTENDKKVAIGIAWGGLNERAVVEAALNTSMENRHLGSGHDVAISFDFESGKWFGPYIEQAGWTSVSEHDGDSVSFKICDCNWDEVDFSDGDDFDATEIADTDAVMYQLWHRINDYAKGGI